MRGFTWATSVVLLGSMIACGGGGAETSPEVGATSSPTRSASGTATQEPEEVSACVKEEPAKRLHTFAIGAIDNAFQPKRLELPAGKKVTIEFANKGSAPHSFTLETLDCDTDPVLAGGSPVAVTFEVPEGKTEFVCTVHASMRGVLVGTRKAD